MSVDLISKCSWKGLMDGDSDRTLDVLYTGTVTCLECSPYSYCDSLMCFASYVSSSAPEPTYRLTIAKLHPKREGDKILEVVKEYLQEKPTTCLSWSPKTFIESLPYDVVLCAGDLDGRICMIRTDTSDNSEIEIIGSHKKTVNAVAFDHESGDLLVSVGDDCKCIVWNLLDGGKHCELPLSSSGIDAKFHQNDSTKLAVVQISGLILLYDIPSMTVFMSLESLSSDITKSFDWPLCDFTRVDSISSSEWHTFDTSNSCVPIATRSLQEIDGAINCALEIRVSPANPKFVAIASQKRVTVLARTENADEVMVTHCVTRRTGSGISWHSSEPLLVCGGDGRLTFVRLEDAS
ncbi:nucleoporin Nup37-like [Watersipora subatra]|uniref:nucleoporin Nup37-like n=1 Tax=Watersipora subatra TaxID=2589382 RepID=UPI00355BB90D